MQNTLRNCSAIMLLQSQKSHDLIVVRGDFFVVRREKIVDHHHEKVAHHGPMMAHHGLMVMYHNPIAVHHDSSADHDVSIAAFCNKNKAPELSGRSTGPSSAVKRAKPRAPSDHFP